MGQKIDAINTCGVRGILFAGRAICGKVGVGEPWKCWSDDACVHKHISEIENSDDCPQGYSNKTGCTICEGVK